MNNNPVLGASYLLRGLGLLGKPRIRRFVLIPLAVNIVLFLVLLYVMFLGFDWMSAQLDALLPDWLDWLKFVLWPVYIVAALLMPVFGFVLIGNLIASPFNGLLAEAVEHHLTGEVAAGDFSWKAMLAELGRSLRSELRKLGYTLVRLVPILVLLWIPGVNIIGSVLWVVFGAWLMAIQYADYPMGNHVLSFPDQRRLLAQRRLLSLGFGGGIMLAMMVPILNFVVMPASVAGATALWVEVYSKLERPSLNVDG